jgi:hypothetical protein
VINKDTLEVWSARDFVDAPQKLNPQIDGSRRAGDASAGSCSG